MRRVMLLIVAVAAAAAATATAHRPHRLLQNLQVGTRIKKETILFLP